MRAHRRFIGLAVVVVALAACRRGEEHAPVPPDTVAGEHVAPTQQTVDANAAVARTLPLDDRQDFDDATRGLVGGEDVVRITGADGHVIWDSTTAVANDGPAPPSVNPSLWRQARLTAIHGLFQVADGVYQVRGYDLSNMTLIRGRSGWIVIDPLTCRETAAAAIALARKYLGSVQVAAVIFTHSHIDHFGGIDGVLPDDAAARAAIPIVAPRGFLEEASSENVLAGPTMARRADYMYGMHLDRSPRGHVTTGLGQEPARGSVGLLAPTEVVDRTPQEMTIDGVPFVFQYVPDSEAPAELTFYLPEQHAWCGAEIVSHTLHNLYTLRGAKVRDALKWSRYIDEAIAMHPDVAVVFGSHHWPVWDNARVLDYLAKQRDTYRFLHDQTLRLATRGQTPQEIAEQLELPSTLRTSFADRGYYGTVRHNAKAVYQWYFGWYDGNPAHLDPLPPEEIAKRYVDAMGGADAVLKHAQEAYDRGDYRWVASLLDHLVFAAPDRTDARELLARTYEQLGYQAESGPWRDVYLTGALELRHGPTRAVIDPATTAALLRRLSPDRLFDVMATRLDAASADGKTAAVNLTFTDSGETWVLDVANAVLHHRHSDPDPNAVATVRITTDLFIRVLTRQASLRETIFSDQLQVEGSRVSLLSFLSMFDQPDFAFPIVTP